MSTATQSTVSPEVQALMNELAQLKAQNEVLKLRKDKPASDRHSLGDGLTCKVSEKGAVSVYGVHSRFPITLYKSQWLRLFSVMANLRAFIEANDSKLAVKTPTVVK